MPDTFFRNERRGAMHNVLVPNLYVRIYADGETSRFSSAKYLCTYFYVRYRTVQYTSVPDALLPHEPEAVPTGHPDVPHADCQL